ncbi:MAG TPA: ATP synthase subunit I [Rhodocyclaceae bacterium]|nr:ATP synthase subunit I [Rhodocyclaceae bacterium]
MKKSSEVEGVPTVTISSTLATLRRICIDVQLSMILKLTRFFDGGKCAAPGTKVKPMFKFVRLQFFAALLGSLLGGILFGARGASSALCGGAAVVLPGFFFAWRLTLAARRPEASHVNAFFIGQAIKIASAIGILVLVRLLFPGAHWGAVVLGLVVTLQANFLALLVKP